MQIISSLVKDISELILLPVGLEPELSNVVPYTELLDLFAAYLDLTCMLSFSAILL